MKNITIRKYSHKWKETNLLDDLKFREIAKSKSAIEEILREILKDNKLEVVSSVEQRNKCKFYFHGVILDCECKLSTNEIVNIEVQVENNDDPILRMRYNQSLLTIENSPKNKDFKYKAIPKIISIMFCDFDLFKMNEPIYEVKKFVNGSDIEVNNGVREIYVNLKSKADDEKLTALFEILKTDKYINENFFPNLSKKKREIVNLEIGGQSMSGLTLEIYKDGEKVGIKKGMEKGIEKGYSYAIKELIKKGIITETEGKKILKNRNNLISK